MKEHNGASHFKSDRQSVVTIGTFDGVHIGHKAILQRLVDTAAKEDLDSVLLTFHPHPRRVLQKDIDIKLLTTLSEKKKHLANIGLDHLVIHPFTQEFSRLTAVEYVRDILVGQLNAKKIIIGYDHRFGRNRTANITDLKEFGRLYNFEIEEIGVQELNEVAVSSTKIRKAIETGNMTTANTYLGYPYSISGTVVEGKRIGRTIAYPTANLKVDEAHKLIPCNGVYVTQTMMDGKRVFGMTSIGTNPTVGGIKKTIETYFLDLDKDLYKSHLQIEFLTHIRDEENFDSIILLKEAIQKDEVFTKDFIKHHE